MFEPEQDICRLAADLVLATQALADAEHACKDTAHTAAVLERSLVALAAEIYALEFDLVLDGPVQRHCGQDRASAERSIRAQAAEFIASLVPLPAASLGAGHPPVNTRMVLGSKFDLLWDALIKAGYLH